MVGGVDSSDVLISIAGLFGLHFSPSKILQMQIPVFKLSLIVDRNTEKKCMTSLEEKFDITCGYISKGIKVYPLNLSTNCGLIKLNICFMTDSFDLVPLSKETFLRNSHASIIMFDVDSRITYKNVPHRYRDLTRVCDDIPIAIVEIGSNNFKPPYIKMRKPPYFRVNSDVTFEKPILWLVKKIVGNEFLRSFEPFAPQLPVEAIGSDSKSEFDLVEGVRVVLPDNDETTFKHNISRVISFDT
mmetsp:Transcript_31733/g.67265  ORF Transcript_31733/g.67265 Transcript_31733/m.67265 type:complete len:243 (-) Transcript_31733:129-857(-)